MQKVSLILLTIFVMYWVFISVIHPSVTTAQNSPQQPRSTTEVWVIDGGYEANPINNISVIDTSKNKLIATIPVPAGKLDDIVINSAGTRAYISSFESNAIYVIDTSTKTLIDTIPTPGVWYFVLNSQGTKIYALSMPDGTISVIDVATKNVVSTIEVPVSTKDIVVNASGSRVFVLSNGAEGIVSTIDTNTNTLINSSSVPGSAFQTLATNPQGNRVYLGHDNLILVFDSDNNSVLSQTPVIGMDSIASSSDGTRLYASGGGVPELSIIDTTSSKVITIVPLTLGSVVDLAPVVISNKTYLYISSSQAYAITVVDTSSNQISSIIPVGRSPQRLAVKP